MDRISQAYIAPGAVEIAAAARSAAVAGRSAVARGGCARSRALSGRPRQRRALAGALARASVAEGASPVVLRRAPSQQRAPLDLSSKGLAAAPAAARHVTGPTLPARPAGQASAFAPARPGGSSAGHSICNPSPFTYCFFTLQENALGFLERRDLAELFYIELNAGQPRANETGIMQDPVWTGITPMIEGPVARTYLTREAAFRQACLVGRCYRIYRVLTQGLRVASFNENRDFNLRFDQLCLPLTDEATVLPETGMRAAYREEMLRHADQEVHVSLQGMNRERILYAGEIHVPWLWHGADDRWTLVVAAQP